jgi:hypothetical protein
MTLQGPTAGSGRPAKAMTALHFTKEVLREGFGIVPCLWCKTASHITCMFHRSMATS